MTVEQLYGKLSDLVGDVEKGCNCYRMAYQACVSIDFASPIIPDHTKHI